MSVTRGLRPREKNNAVQSGGKSALDRTRFQQAIPNPFGDASDESPLGGKVGTDLALRIGIEAG
jgi:hypothetical protein